jgi:hypothetical protein
MLDAKPISAAQLGFGFGSSSEDNNSDQEIEQVEIPR